MCSLGSFILLYVYVCVLACLCARVNTVVHGGQKETLNLLELGVYEPPDTGDAKAASVLNTEPPVQLSPQKNACGLRASHFVCVYAWYILICVHTYMGVHCTHVTVRVDASHGDQASSSVNALFGSQFFAQAGAH